MKKKRKWIIPETLALLYQGKKLFLKKKRYTVNYDV